MWSRLFTFTSVASLLVCTGLIALSIRGFFAIDQWSYTTYESSGGVVWTILSGRGGLGVARSRIGTAGTTSASPSNVSRPSWWHRAGAPRYPEWTRDGTMLHIESHGFEYLSQDVVLGGIGRPDVSLKSRAVTMVPGGHDCGVADCMDGTLVPTAGAVETKRSVPDVRI